MEIKLAIKTKQNNAFKIELKLNKTFFVMLLWLL